MQPKHRAQNLRLSTYTAVVMPSLFGYPELYFQQKTVLKALLGFHHAHI